MVSLNGQEKLGVDHDGTPATDTLLAPRSFFLVGFQVPAAGQVNIKDNTSALGPPPDGGAVAWLQVLGAWMLSFNSWGVINAFGAFQTYYESAILANESPSNISWIGSIQAFLTLFVGVLSGPLFDAGYFRLLLLVGTILVPLGFMMTSLCTSYWQVILAQGVCVGLGNGCTFTPSVSVIPQYFVKRRVLALGIAATGSSMGGVIYPILFHQLQPRIGFAWTTRILGFVSLGTMAISVVVLKLRVAPKKRRALLQLSAFKEAPYTLYCLVEFGAFVGFLGPPYYVQPYVIQNHITNPNLALYLVPILNAASVFGRILPSYLADHIGPLNMLVPVTLSAGIITLFWPLCRSTASVIIFAALYGFFSGGIVSLSPAPVASLTPDISYMGARMGMCFLFASAGVLIGAPVDGAIVSGTGDYTYVALFSGLVLMGTAVLVVMTRVARYGTRVWVKA